HAEVRHTGRWLHALVLFRDGVDLHSANDQRRWVSIHRALKGSVPSDPAAPALIALTRPVGSVNGKTGGVVKTIKEGSPIDASTLLGGLEEVRKRPFETLGEILFGEKRVAPCPYCAADGSHLDVGELVGFCYGPCRRIPLKQLHQPFLKDTKVAGEKEE